MRDTFQRVTTCENEKEMENYGYYDPYSNRLRGWELNGTRPPSCPLRAMLLGSDSWSGSQV
jgi:hypothetical protein